MKKPLFLIVFLVLPLLLFAGVTPTASSVSREFIVSVNNIFGTPLITPGLSSLVSSYAGPFASTDGKTSLIEFKSNSVNMRTFVNAINTTGPTVHYYHNQALSPAVLAKYPGWASYVTANNITFTAIPKRKIKP